MTTYRPGSSPGLAREQVFMEQEQLCWVFKMNRMVKGNSSHNYINGFSKFENPDFVIQLVKVTKGFYIQQKCDLIQNLKR